jgi:hypothetical protein
MQARVSNLLPFVPILLRSCIRKEILRSRNWRLLHLAVGKNIIPFDVSLDLAKSIILYITSIF